MSDTPETDAASYVDPTPGFDVVSAEFSRNLERQRTALLEALEGLLSNAVPVAADIEGDKNVVRMTDFEWAEVVIASDRARAAIAKAKAKGESA